VNPNFPDRLLEIAAIFLAHAVNYFLKPSGRLAFVLPRSFMSADQHDNTRSGAIKGVKLTQAWDLEGVSPLFRVPACVLFAVRTDGAQAQRQLSPAGIPGLAIAGRLPHSQIHWNEAKGKLSLERRQWHYSRLQSGRGAARSALTARLLESLSGVNAYEARFTQGATMVPRNFFFVELEQPGVGGGDLRNRVVALRTSTVSEREAKPPWKGNLVSGRVEGSLLFRTAISRNVIPFALVDPPLVVLPVMLEDTPEGGTEFVVETAEELFERGYQYGSEWFLDVEKIWEAHKTDKNRELGMTLSNYLNWQNKLTDQNPKARHLVLYTSSATDACATVIDGKTFDHPFVVDHMTYWCHCGSAEEAHYLSAYVNSGYANAMIKEFQARGLFGGRHVHKLIVKVPFPTFDKNAIDHLALSELGSKCARLADNFVRAARPDNLHARALGTMRSRLRDQLSAELAEIDCIVEKLSSGTVDTRRGSRGRSRRLQVATRRLFD
jgi:hypothetical protein